MALEWYVILSDDSQVGPMSEEEVRRLVTEGKLSRTSYCWNETMQGWAPLEQVGPFSAMFESAPGRGIAQAGEMVQAWLDRGKRGAMRMMKASRLHLQLGKLKRTRDKLCMALGEETYRQRADLVLTDAMKIRVDSIMQCDNEIAAVEKELAELEGSRGESPVSP